MDTKYDEKYFYGDTPWIDAATKLTAQHMFTLTRASRRVHVIQVAEIAKREYARENPDEGYFSKLLHDTMIDLKNIPMSIGIALHTVGGLIDRTLGLGTMIAANALELGGKILKLPIWGLSKLFNKVTGREGTRKAWRVDYDLGKNWKSVDDGRVIFRRYLKGALILLPAVRETLTRGIPALFGHHFKSGVYKRTRRWGGDVINDVKRVLNSIGLGDTRYDEMERGKQDALFGKYKNYDDDDDDFDDDEDSEDEIVEKKEN